MARYAQRFLGIAGGAMLIFAAMVTPDLRPVSTPMVHASSNWTGGSAPGSGQAPWETLVGGVNIANGNLTEAGAGPSVRGVNGLALAISPIYNSLSAANATDLGHGWIMGTGRDVGLDLSVAGAATFYDPTGHGYTFANPSSCVFNPPPGIDAQLACSGSGYTLTANASGLQYQFDSGGNLTVEQNRQGNQIQFAYNTAGQLTQITNTEGQLTTVSYDGSGRVSQITPPGTPAHIWTYSYDASSNLTKITDAASNAVQYAYDSSSRLTKITDALGNVTNVSYDSLGRVSQIVQVTNPTTQTGPTWTYAYSAGSTQVTDPNNHASTYVFDSSNRVTSVTDPESHTSQTVWTADNQVAQTIAPSGATTTLNYDSSNRLTQTTSPTGVIKTLAYNDPNHPYLPTSATDENGNTTTTQYNSQGLPTSVTDALNHTTTTAYNANGTVASVTDANNHATSYSYNSLGLLNQVTPPSPLGSTVYSYDVYDRLSATTDGKGQTTGYALDQVGNQLAAAYADGSSVTYAYDADGNRTSRIGNLTDQGVAHQEQITNGGFESGTSPWQVSPSTLQGWRVYDPFNGHSGSYYAKLESNLTYAQQLWQTVTVPSSYSKLTLSYWLSISTAKTSICDAFKVSIRTTGGTPITTLSNPCPSGSLCLGKWAQESADLTFPLASYRGQQVQVFFQAQNPSTDQTSATYRIDDVSFNGGTDNTTYQYDALGQLTQQSGPAATTTQLFYDNAGNLTETYNPNGGANTRYTYGANNELLTLTDQWNNQTSFNYDVDGNETQDTYANGAQQQFTYNSAGQPTGLTALSNTGATLASLSWNYTNPATNKQTDLVYSKTGVAGNVTANTYDPLGRLTQATVKNSSGTTLATYAYTYDAVGNLLSKAKNGAVTSMTHDAANELTQAGATTFTHDKNGNRTGDSTGTALAYNTANQNTSVTPAGASAVSMAYAGATRGQRVASGANTYGYDPTGLTSYFRVDNKGITYPSYLVHRPDTGLPLEYHTSGGTLYYVVDPTNGSDTAALDTSGGSLADTYDYSPTGEAVDPATQSPVDQAAVDPNNPVGFDGMTYDSNTGLYDNGDGSYDAAMADNTQSQDANGYDSSGDGGVLTPDEEISPNHLPDGGPDLGSGPGERQGGTGSGGGGQEKCNVRTLPIVEGKITGYTKGAVRDICGYTRKARRRGGVSNEAIVEAVEAHEPTEREGFLVYQGECAQIWVRPGPGPLMTVFNAFPTHECGRRFPMGS